MVSFKLTHRKDFVLSFNKDDRRPKPDHWLPRLQPPTDKHKVIKLFR